MNTFSKMWGLYTPEQVQAKIEEQRAEYIAQKKKERGLAPEEAFVPQNLEEQAISLAGTDIYEKLIREYTQKQCAEAVGTSVHGAAGLHHPEIAASVYL